MDEVEFADTPEPELIDEKSTPKVKRETSPPTLTEIPPEAVISLSALVVNSNSKNSASVRWVQRRLIELGHLSAGADLQGALEDGTVEALTEYQAKAKVSAESVTSRAVIASLMKGTPARITE